MADRRPHGDPSPTSPLFDVPQDRLGARLHEEVFGALPPATGRALDVPAVAAAVRPLLAAGWRPAQLAARVAALPAAPDPVATVSAFLEALLERDIPLRRRDRERVAGPPVPASEQSRTRWPAETRRALGLPPRVHRPAAPPARVGCALCRGPGEFFVTREVRLCGGCVERLRAATERVAWAPTG